MSKSKEPEWDLKSIFKALALQKIWLDDKDRQTTLKMNRLNEITENLKRLRMLALKNRIL